MTKSSTFAQKQSARGGQLKAQFANAHPCLLSRSGQTLNLARSVSSREMRADITRRGRRGLLWARLVKVASLPLRRKHQISFCLHLKTYKKKYCNLVRTYIPGM